MVNVRLTAGSQTVALPELSGGLAHHPLTVNGAVNIDQNTRSLLFLWSSQIHFLTENPLTSGVLKDCETIILLAIAKTTPSSIALDQSATFTPFKWMITGLSPNQAPAEVKKIVKIP